MSHHLDTPLARQNGRLYIDDLYVFDSDGSTVFVMDVNSNITGPDITPGFHPEARYEIKTHFDGAEFENLTYRVEFDEADADGRQTYTVSELIGAAARDDNATGTEVARGRTGEPVDQGGLRVWAGRIQDAFYVDLNELSVINAAVADGTTIDLSSWSASPANNSFAGTLVYAIVIEVPHSHAQLQPGASVGAWCASKLATDAGGFRQINRAGFPMMWPIFWPHDTDFSNPANDRHPSADFGDDGKYIAEKVAAVVAANKASDDPQGYGSLVARRLFPDVLPYVIGTPASFGFSGINGRTRADNSPEVMFALVLNKPTSSGLDLGTTADQRRNTFPYVVEAS
jgi:hypothetical protein